MIIKLLFWNLARNSIEKYIADIINENDIDICVFAEYNSINFEIVLSGLNNSYTLFDGMGGCDKIALIARSGYDVEIRREQNRYTIYSVYDNTEKYIITDTMIYKLSNHTHQARFLLNYRMDSENPMALILSGQTELWDKLRLSAYRAILERVDIDCFLTPMDFADTKRYIKTQLLYAGHETPIFTEDAMKSIFEFSGGNPDSSTALAVSP